MKKENHSREAPTYEALQQENISLKEKIKELELDIEENVNKDALTALSKKLNLEMQNKGEQAMIEMIAFHRGVILDHFLLAYMAETGAEPSRVRLVQGIDDRGFFNIYFERNTKIITELGL